MMMSPNLTSIYLVISGLISGQLRLCLQIQVSRVRAPALPHNVEIDHEIISVAILPLPLIQEVQLSVTGESMCTKLLVNSLGLSLPRNSVSGLPEWPKNNFCSIDQL